MDPQLSNHEVATTTVCPSVEKGAKTHQLDNCRTVRTLTTPQSTPAKSPSVPVCYGLELSNMPWMFLFQTLPPEPPEPLPTPTPPLAPLPRLICSPAGMLSRPCLQCKTQLISFIQPSELAMLMGVSTVVIVWGGGSINLHEDRQHHAPHYRAFSQ